ncbi:phosphatase PAP2/dual specificity phosphatase family protein [Arenimonas sp.]|uniref:phosphatase PAP2/dual specificity phosphatase family protein n=1 Tax=Arenimonas sp. TaxID=1872635 RepID=UPI0039E2BC9C
MNDDAWQWRRGLAWLALLGPLFYLSYGFANHLAASRSGVPSIVFDWERGVPFMAWTILPYWTINAFYAASLLVHRRAADVDRQGRRLLTAQFIAVSCFILFPLKFAFTRPETEGWSGAMFDALTSFDKPFNQAPSLHIALLVILWSLYTPKLPRAMRPVLHLWFALIGVSVLTTYQHHFIDIPTGVLLGAFCLWCWPNEGPSPLTSWRRDRDATHWRLAGYYGLGALACVALAHLGGAWLWSLWPAVSLLLIALAYAGLDSRVFQKTTRGRIPLGPRLLLMPYLLAARVNQGWWTRGSVAAVSLGEGVSFGRVPRIGERLAAGESLVDLSAELDSSGATVRAIPCLDLIPPSPAQLREACAAIEAARSTGDVRVACALGFSRSASAVLAWWLRTGRESDLAQAEQRLRALQPRLVLTPTHREAIAAAVHG